MSARAARVATFVVLAVLLTTATSWLIVSSWDEPAAEAYYWRGAGLVNAVVWFVYAMAGAFLYLRRPDTPVGWLLSGIGLGMLATGVAIEYAVRTVLVDPSGHPAVAVVAIAGQVAWSVPFGLLAVLLAVYPTGRVVGPGWRAAVVLAVVAVVLILASAVPRWAVRDQVVRMLSDDDLPDAPAAEAVVAVGLVLLLCALLVAAASLLVRWRRATGVERLQIRWLALAAAVASTVGAATVRAASLWAEIVFLVGLLSIPAAIVIAITRHGLYEIDRIVSRTVTYAVLTAVLAVVYIVVAVVPAALLGASDGGGPGTSDVLVAAATLSAAGLFVPLRRRVQAVVDRRFNGARRDGAAGPRVAVAGGRSAMSRRAAPRLAWSLWGRALLFLSWSTTGAIVTSRRPGHPIGRLLLVVALAVGAEDVASAYAVSCSRRTRPCVHRPVTNMGRNVGAPITLPARVMWWSAGREQMR